MKKVIIILCFLIVIGAGGFGTYHFYKENQKQIEQTAILTQKNAQIQAQINAIGSMTTVYQVSQRVYSGAVIKQEDLLAVSVPASTIKEYSITDINELIGKSYRIDIHPGTVLTKDLLMQEGAVGPKMEYTRELTLSSLPVGTKVGDYIDLRFLMPNGEEYPIFTHKQIKRIFNTTITIEVNEEEHAVLNAAIQDLGNYEGYCLIYAMKYLEPGNDVDTIAYFPVQHELENFIKFNPNIIDITRCINETLRDHIDEVFLIYTNSVNSQVSSTYIGAMSSQLSSQLAMHNTWLQENTDENGNINIEGDEYPNEGSGIDDFKQEVDDAYNDLQQNLEDLEAIK